MRRGVAKALVVANLMVSLCASAQPRGGSHSSLSHSAAFVRTYPAAPRTQPRPLAARPAASTRTTRAGSIPFNFPPATGSSLVSSGQSACLLNPSYADSFYCRQYYPHGASLGFEPIYPFWFPSGGTESGAPPAPAADSGPDPLTEQVGNLATEVQLMREEQALRDARNASASAPPVAPEEKPPSTLLVYRDGHQVEVQNYAVQGSTLWVFSEQSTRRVPLTDLDLTATRRINGERGVDFSNPESQ